MDPGSVIVAGTFAACVGVAVIAALRALGVASPDVTLGFGEGLAVDPIAAAIAAAAAQLVFGVSAAFVLSAVWASTRTPPAPWHGVLLAVPVWLAAEIAIGAFAPFARRRRGALSPARDAWSLLGAHLAFGYALGAAYLPGA